MNFIVSCYIFSFIPIYTTCMPNIIADKISFISDFIKSQSRPYVVSENLCWKGNHIKHLQKTLFDEYISVIPYRSNKTNLKNVFSKERYYTSIVISEINCNFDVLYNENYLTRLTIFPHIWIIFGEIDQLTQYNFYITINTLFLNANYDFLTRNITLTSLYKFNRKFQGYVMDHVGIWRRNAPFYWNEFILTSNRSNFHKEPLTVSYVVTNIKLFKKLEDYRYTYIDYWSKTNHQCFKFISDLYNMTHKRLFRPAWSPASIQDPKLSGMYGDVTRGTHTFTPKERHHYFRYIYTPLKDIKRSVYFRAPPLAYHSNLFFLPFEKMVWITFSVLVILCCITTKIAFKYEKQLTEHLNENRTDTIKSPSWWDVILMQIAVICQMDMYYEPKNISGRITTFIILILSTFLYTAFSARIVLLLQSYTNDIQNMDDLIQSKYIMAIEDTTFNRYFVSIPLPRTTEHLRKGFQEGTWKKPPGRDYFLSTSDGVKLVRDDYAAFQAEHTSANYLIGKTYTPEQTCAIRTVETFFKSDVTYVCCRRNTSYYEYFLVGFKRLIDAGIQSREQIRGFVSKPPCQGAGNTYVTIGIVECYFAYLIFGIGITLSLIFFCLELSINYYLKHRKSEMLKVRPFNDNL